MSVVTTHEPRGRGPSTDDRSAVQTSGDRQGVVARTPDRRVILSTLWVVVMFNMVFADILSFITPGALQELWTGQAGVQLTPGLLLVFAILLEVPIAMIFVSRILKQEANRWANPIAAVITTLFVVGGGSMSLHYVFFAAVEIACMALIVWYAWTWRRPVGQPDEVALAPR